MSVAPGAKKRFDSLARQRPGLIRSLQESSSDLDAALVLVDVSLDIVEDFYKDVCKDYKSFQENQSLIALMGILEADSTLLLEHEQFSGQARKCYMDVVQKYVTLKKSLTLDTDTTASAQQTKSKLENIPTPEWDGSRTSYAGWKGQFIRAMVKHHQDEDDQLSRVKKSVKDPQGVWKRRVQSCNTICDVWQLLDIEFGCKQKLIEEIYSNIKSYKLRSEDARGLADFASTISDFMRNVSDAGHSEEIKSILFISELRSKLSPENQKSFSKDTMKDKKEENAENLVEWLRTESLLLSRSEPKSSRTLTKVNSVPAFNSKFARNVFATHDNLENPVKCSFCDDSHDTRDCVHLAAKPQRIRVKFVRNSGSCFCCFKKGHRNVQCSEDSTCVQNGCRWKTPHHKLLCTVLDTSINCITDETPVSDEETELTEQSE